MARNELPPQPGPLLYLGDHMLGGLTVLGTALNITDITPATFQPVLNAFANSNNAYLTARAAQMTASLAVQAADESNGTWLLKVRGVLTGRLGSRWSTAWVAAGFVNGSTAVPANAVERLRLVGQLVNYFNANPSYAVATMEVTAAKASALQSAATTANNSYNGARTNAETKHAARSTAEAALRSMMRGLIGILLMKLGKTDPRWSQFGLNIPASRTAPGKPGTPTVVVQPANTIVATCPPVPRATRYRWRIQVVGVDKGFRLGASTTAPLAEIKSVLAGQTVDLYVEAVNRQSRGVSSDVVQVMLPLPAVPASPSLSSLSGVASAGLTAATFSPPGAVVERATELPPTAIQAPDRGAGHRNGNGALTH